MIKIEYWNTYDVLDTHYEGLYRNRFWLNVDIKKPNYIVTREQSADSKGDNHNDFLKWEKQYTFELFCTESLSDAISTITMCDNVFITFENGFTTKVKEFLADITWESIDSVAKVVATLVTDSYYINGASAAGCI
jgi:hypothetical protein